VVDQVGRSALKKALRLASLVVAAVLSIDTALEQDDRGPG
jgi:hypothetical protein